MAVSTFPRCSGENYVSPTLSFGRKAVRAVAAGFSMGDGSQLVSPLAWSISGADSDTSFGVRPRSPYGDTHRRILASNQILAETLPDCESVRSRRTIAVGTCEWAHRGTHLSPRLLLQLPHPQTRRA